MEIILDSKGLLVYQMTRSKVWQLTDSPDPYQSADGDDFAVANQATP